MKISKPLKCHLGSPSSIYIPPTPRIYLLKNTLRLSTDLLLEARNRISRRYDRIETVLKKRLEILEKEERERVQFEKHRYQKWMHRDYENKVWVEFDEDYLGSALKNTGQKEEDDVYA